jgi:hypothetical protein
MSSANAALKYADLLSCAALNAVLFAAYDIVPRDVTDPSSEQLRRLLDYVQTLKSDANSIFKSGACGNAFTAYNFAHQARCGFPLTQRYVRVGCSETSQRWRLHC